MQNIQMPLSMGTNNTPTKKSLATLDGEIVDPEITIKIEMRHVPKAHDVQT